MSLKKFAATFLVATVVLGAPTVSLAEENSAVISVTGSGTAEAAPDMAVISIGVLREAKTAREALDANNQAMGDVLAAMGELGIAEKDLQTSSFNIQPRYVYPKRKSDGTQPAPSIVGYTVSNNLTIRIRDIASTGSILDQLVTLGVNTGGSIRFTNQDTNGLTKVARTNAVKDAVARAETLAAAAGVELGDIKSISEQSFQSRPQPIVQARAMAAESADAVPIATGENSYRVSVNITWEIEQ